MRSRYADPGAAIARTAAPRLGGPTFPLRDRALRLVWAMAWGVLARFTPPQFMPLRRALLRLFGAKIDRKASVRGSAQIWWPANLVMEPYASLGPGTVCYNVAPITIGEHAIVSQRAHLCTGTHDIDDPDFPLRERPIVVGAQAWIAAEAFVGPGVTVGEGAVLGARAVAVRDLDAWTVHAGNPARAVRKRQRPSYPRTASSE
jgi:putative colanic acid biosynthesis acetyltransferase WcaF